MSLRARPALQRPKYTKWPASAQGRDRPAERAGRPAAAAGEPGPVGELDMVRAEPNSFELE
jgi:hypothetical protein